VCHTVSFLPLRVLDVWTCSLHLQVVHLEERASVYAIAANQAMHALAAWREEATRTHNTAQSATAQALFELEEQRHQRAVLGSGAVVCAVFYLSAVSCGVDILLPPG
jgi:hypothetical protein